uniref:Uncharacterized protein n=1 Tax=Romanomermis culicivorax TaxID=13658 RepID=A0A915JED4_ROMCU
MFHFCTVQKSFSNDEIFLAGKAVSPSSSSRNCGLAHFPSLTTSSDYVVDKIEEEFLVNSRRLPSTSSETACLLPSSPKIAGDNEFACSEKTPLQLLTASDLKMLDDLSDLAAKMSEAALTNERQRFNKIAAFDEETNSVVAAKLASKKSGDSDSTTPTAPFCENLSKEKRVEESLGADALNAYKSLVDEGLASAVNPLQLLRNNGATVVRSFQRNSNSASPTIVNFKSAKCPDSVAPPPIPPKFASTATTKKAKNPPPVPPKPISGSTNSPILPPKPVVINYTSIVDDQAKNLTSDDGKTILEGKEAEKLAYFPQFTAETVDKYELLNFVLAPLSSRSE